VRLNDKVAIVTGAGSGFGRGIAMMFAREGARVVVADIDQAAGDETASRIKADGNKATAAHVDVSMAKDTEKMVKTAVDNYGKIDILVNNAAICRLCAITDLTEQEWDRHININLKGVWLTSRVVIPHMIKAGGGSIVNIASLSGVKARPLMAVYSASKGGVIMLTRQMAVELAPQNIRCNSISPVFGKTSMGEVLIKQYMDIYRIDDPKFVTDSLYEAIPLKRGVKPEDIAYATLYLASDEASLITGDNLLIDGGARA
jgi:3-oxoacyl-[acyl-carrier protein] reductase